MEKASETCKLCLKYIEGDGMVALEDKILDRLDFLQLDLEQSVEESNSICKECEEKVENAYDFKSFLVNVIESSGSEDIDQNIPSTSTGETSAEKTVCHLCKNSVDKLSVISLTKLLKDDCMMEVFQGHIQEVDMKKLDENSMVCEMCQKSLASFSTLVSSWLIASEWNEDDTKDNLIEDDFEVVEVKKEEPNDDEFSDSNTNSSCAIEVSDTNSATNASTSKKGKGKRGQSTSAASSSSSSKRIKTEIYEVSDSNESISLNSKDIKKEETEETEETEEINEDLQLKSEEIDIKDEDGDQITISKCYQQDGCRTENRSKLELKTERGSEAETVKPSVAENAILQNSPENGRQLKSPGSIDNKSLRPTYICDHCTYKTEQRTELRKHLHTHGILENLQHVIIPKYECPYCSYVGKKKCNLLVHMGVHRSLAEQEKFEASFYKYRCHECPFKTVRKTDYDRHSYVHKTPEERQKYKERLPTYHCDQCQYSTKKRFDLKRHLIIHKPTEERQKCKEELQIYDCQLCSFQAFVKNELKKHMNAHIPLEKKRKLKERLTTHECPFCSFTTKLKRCLQKHLITHKSLKALKILKEKLPTLQCEECPYNTKKNYKFKKHLLSHKTTQERKKIMEEMPDFVCRVCGFTTKSRPLLYKHIPTHKTVIENLIESDKSLTN